MRLREHFEKPSEKRAREKAEGIRRTRKLARKKLSRELGIAPVRKPKTVSDAKSFLGIPVVFDASLNTVSTPAFQGLAARWLTSDATAD